MVPLGIWVTVFVGLRVAALFGLRISAPAAARHALALMLIFTASSHAFMLESLSTMLPPWVPAARALVLATGVLEGILAVQLFLVVKTRRERMLGWMLIGLFCALFPANIYSAIAGTGPTGDRGVTYLWFRAPVQLLFIASAWYALLSRAAGEGFRAAREA